MKGFEVNSIKKIVICLIVIFLSTFNQAENLNNFIYGDISKTDLNKFYKLKQFDIYEIKSSQDNIYTFLKFKNSTVESKKKDTFYSKSNVFADMYVRVEEGNEFKNNTLQQIIDKSISYIINNITESNYYEEKNIAYQIVKYNIFNEIKNKIVVCVKTDTGYIVHDFSYFENCNDKEKKIIKECIQDIYTIFNLSNNKNKNNNKTK